MMSIVLTCSHQRSPPPFRSWNSPCYFPFCGMLAAFGIDTDNFKLLLFKMTCLGKLAFDNNSFICQRLISNGTSFLRPLFDGIWGGLSKQVLLYLLLTKITDGGLTKHARVNYIIMPTSASFIFLLIIDNHHVRLLILKLASPPARSSRWKKKFPLWS